jgi:hypothetical protein
LDLPRWARLYISSAFAGGSEKEPVKLALTLK